MQLTSSAIAPLPGSPVDDLGFVRSHAIAMVLIAAFLVAAPAFIYPMLPMKVMCYALFAASFNLIYGYTGLLPFGHAAFFGMGAYAAAWAAKSFGLTPEIAIAIGGLVGAALGAAIGAFSVRAKGLVFAMTTLALAQLVYFVCLQAPGTGGENGIQDIPRGRLLGVWSLESDYAMYALVTLVFFGAGWAYYRSIHSPFGQVLVAIREHEDRTRSLGFNVLRYKWAIFTLSALLAGIAGGTKALVFGVATLTDVQIETSSLVLLMAIVGGSGSVFGPLAGAVVVVLMENSLAQYESWVSVLKGCVLVACVMVFKQGIVGELASRMRTRI